MTALVWDAIGARFYETGVDRGVLYIPNGSGVYDTGFAWNGLTTVTETPDGAAATPQYADNIQYLNLVSAEILGGTIEAFTYPDQFAQCDGTATPNTGVAVGQQSRKSFGLAYRTRVGNDVSGTDLGYKLHLLYGALAAPSEKAYATVNDTPEALAFSWGFSTSPVAVTGLKPTSLLTIDTTKALASGITALEAALYGGSSTTPRLPLPDEVIAMFAGALTPVTTVAPTYNVSTHVLTVPSTTGVVYRRTDTGAVVAGGATITLVTGQTLVLKATPAAGYVFTAGSDDDWSTAY